MPLKIEIKNYGSEESSEHKAALCLENLFSEALKNINGQILIVANATLFGQETKDVDLIVMGEFEQFKNPKFNNVYINNFCFVIEVKNHDIDSIRLDGVSLKVKYSGKYSDATNQSQNEKNSLMRFFQYRLKYSPYICNFIWLRQVSLQELDLLTEEKKDNNILPETFNLDYLFERAFIQHKIFRKGPAISFSCYLQKFDLSGMKDCFDLFTKIKQGMSRLTRAKVELISKKLLDTQKYYHSIGQKLVIVSGRAGTGKTIKILRIACDLAKNQNKRCLVLTYNKALVADIKRVIAFMQISDGIDSYTVSIQTIHHFIRTLLIGFGIKDGNIPDFIDNYDKYLKELYECINNGLIEQKDIQSLMKQKYEQVAWDYILIDEGQDWKENEKFILYKIFGPNNMIIADGMDQLIRSKNNCNWEKGINERIESHKTHEKKCLRQKNNLSNFVNLFAKEFGIDWKLDAGGLNGGKVIITTKPYSAELHRIQYENCKAGGGDAYDMMFFVPPLLVQKTNKNDHFGKTIKQFSLIEDFNKMGIKIWDGTNTDLRTEYAVDLDEHRLLQYDSCRGLEGWTVVCLYFDEFVKYKKDTYDEDEKRDDLALYTKEQEKDRFVYLWSLIPLTRAIDTLVITLKDKNCEYSKKLYKIYKDNPDFIEWIE